DSPPNLVALYGKAVLTGLTRRGGGDLPDTAYELPRVAVSRAHLATYNRVCGFRLTDELPATYPHVLGFPLQIKLMTDPGFPFALVGSVHLANRISQTRPLRVGEKLGIRVHVANLRPHAKGRQFDMITEVASGGEVVWTGVSTYMSRASAAKSTSARLRRGGGTGEEAGKSDPVAVPEPTAI